MPIAPSRSLFFAAILGAGLSLAACTAPPEPSAATPKPVERLDLARYLGTWHEIARYPNRFQTQCTGASTATYSLRADGDVRVVNRCRVADGSQDEAEAVARPVGTARLQVRFAPWWLSWLPGVWGDYWVIDLDPDYRLAAVSDPTRRYLWILARSPQVAPEALEALLARLRAQGFDTTALLRDPAS